MDPEEQRRVCAVGDARAGDVADARPRSARPRHHDADPGVLEERTEAQRHPEVQLGLAQAGRDPVRPAAVLDLQRARARPDRLGPGICAKVVPGVDDDDGSRRRGGRGQGEREHEDGEEAAHD
jgi:hypothetical protein